MIREFKAKFGSGEETVIAIGDWEQKQHRKFKEPIRARGSVRSYVRQSRRCIWSMSFAVVAAVAIAMNTESVRPSWSVRTRERTVPDASCVMGLSGIRPANVYGTGIPTRLKTSGRSQTAQSTD
eukprot:NODE_5_length_49639_cov_0.484336.p25 type:complete len:124 gc:universal NODE_5_length_49639_cov_0.484336:39460-39089(-)